MDNFCPLKNLKENIVFLSSGLAQLVERLTAEWEPMGLISRVGPILRVLIK